MLPHPRLPIRRPVSAYAWLAACALALTPALAAAALPNLRAVDYPAGWSFPLVPRNLAGATAGSAAGTTQLDGGASDTWLNAAVRATSSGSLPGWSVQVVLDGQTLEYTGAVAAMAATDTSVRALDLGPYVVRGGRHTLALVADPSGTVAESNESDNTWSAQWAWLPPPSARAVPAVRTVPPPRGTWPEPNSDGFRFDRASGSAWVVSLAPLVPGDDYDLYCYDDYANPVGGYGHRCATSTQPGALTEFVVGHYSGTPLTVYPAAVRYSIDGGGGAFAIDQTDGTGRYAFGGFARWSQQDMGANRLADVYEASFTAGKAYRLVLARDAGASDLAFEVFPGVSGGIYARGAGAASIAVGDSLDTLTVVAAASGIHPIVVYRTTALAAGTPVTYSLAWGTGAILAAPPAGAPVALALSGAVPNPVRSEARFAIALPRGGHVRLALYDIGGRRVRTLVDAERAAGRFDVAWDVRGDDGARLGAGVYVARLECGGTQIARRLTVLE